jgi:hypothetical protein
LRLNEKEPDVTGADQKMRNTTIKSRLIKVLDKQSRAVAAISTSIPAELLETLSVQANETARKKALISELRQIDKQLLDAHKRIGRALDVLKGLTPMKGSTQQAQHQVENE